MYNCVRTSFNVVPNLVRSIKLHSLCLPKAVFYLIEIIRVDPWLYCRWKQTLLNQQIQLKIIRYFENGANSIYESLKLQLVYHSKLIGCWSGCEKWKIVNINWLFWNRYKINTGRRFVKCSCPEKYLESNLIYC